MTLGVDERGAQGGARPGDDLEEVGVRPGARQEAAHGQGRERRVRIRFEHDGVARHERRDGVGGGQGQGVVPRRDNADDAQGPVVDDHPGQARHRPADLQGLPVPASQLLLGNHLFMPQQKGYQDNSGDLTFNKDQAIKELEELGWVLPEGKEFREKDGQTLSIKYLRLPDTATSATEGKILQANMKDIGVEVVMDDTNNDDFFPERVSPGKFEIVTYAWIGTPYPLANIGQPQ